MKLAAFKALFVCLRSRERRGIIHLNYNLPALVDSQMIRVQLLVACIKQVRWWSVIQDLPLANHYFNMPCGPSTSWK